MFKKENTTINTESNHKYSTILHSHFKTIENPSWDADYKSYIKNQQDFYDKLAEKWDFWHNLNSYYHKMTLNQYQLMIPPKSSILEVGCATGELLVNLKPKKGVGVDISPKMIKIAQQKFQDTNIEFIATPIEQWQFDGYKFDYIILSDFVGLLRDLELVFHKLRKFCHARTRLILNFHSQVWMPIFKFAERFGLKAKSSRANWVTKEDVFGLLKLAGFEPIRQYSRILIPKKIPVISNLLNNFFARLIPFRWFCISNFIVSRLPMTPYNYKPKVSVICPCRNEAGNIEKIIARLPQMGSGTELIFVEGASTDDTYEQCLRSQDKNKGTEIKVFRQANKGKGDAVRLGFSKASGDIYMILDADMTVPPEDLLRFYRVIMDGTVEFVNGSRLVYPMNSKAMRFLNLCGNKFFAWAFSRILGQTVKDTLCGTKVLIRSDYIKIAESRDYFGHLDPFGDFDLLFGAAKLNLKIQDLPIIYRDRIYGTTNINRFSHGWLLFKMIWIGYSKLK